MRRLFPNYQARYEKATQVMGAMAQEIVNLRKEKDDLKKRIRELEGVVETQGETLFDLHSDIRDARAALDRAK